MWTEEKNVARMSEVINVYCILGSKSEMRGHLGELSVDGDIILTFESLLVT